MLKLFKVSKGYGFQGEAVLDLTDPKGNSGVRCLSVVRSENESCRQKFVRALKDVLGDVAGAEDYIHNSMDSMFRVYQSRAYRPNSSFKACAACKDPVSYRVNLVFPDVIRTPEGSVCEGIEYEFTYAIKRHAVIYERLSYRDMSGGEFKSLYVRDIKHETPQEEVYEPFDSVIRKVKAGQQFGGKELWLTYICRCCSLDFSKHSIFAEVGYVCKWFNGSWDAEQFSLFPFKCEISFTRYKDIFPLTKYLIPNDLSPEMKGIDFTFHFLSRLLRQLDDRIVDFEICEDGLYLSRRLIKHGEVVVSHVVSDAKSWEYLHAVKHAFKVCYAIVNNVLYIQEDYDENCKGEQYCKYFVDLLGAFTNGVSDIDTQALISARDEEFVKEAVKAWSADVYRVSADDEKEYEFIAERLGKDDLQHPLERRLD